MNKPSWIDQVKEITDEEADLLMSLGVDVWADYSHDGHPGGWDPEPTHLRDRPLHYIEWASYIRTGAVRGDYFYYILKEDE